MLLSILQQDTEALYEHPVRQSSCLKDFWVYMGEEIGQEVNKSSQRWCDWPKDDSDVPVQGCSLS